ncbi:proline racemase family protein [Leeia sp. TBRC 13508]|uniref:Proline racemase family protein n=1 Tax=Leeia speluncae TaxID=2884804 RepID=A0ABS8D908_9NEIS|nr:proline racemase family protein [Leeia speluncae]MCB6184689.1 proline racemase family protein [Leeia speluncae]
MEMNQKLFNSAYIEMVNVHCQGEIGKVITAGAPEIPGLTPLDKMNYINHVDDSFRKFITREPRSSLQMSINLLVKPSSSEYDAAFLILQADQAHAMSGSNCMCVVTALIELNLVKVTSPITTLKLETPAGLIHVTASVEDGKCKSVTLENVPSFLLMKNHPFEFNGKTLHTDIAFGGVFYALVDATDVGLRISPENAKQLADFGMQMKAMLNQQLEIKHPELDGLNNIAYVMFRDKDENGEVITCTTMKPGRVDRSPCGTGSSANLASRFENEQLPIGYKQSSRSIIGGNFITEIKAFGTLGAYKTITPQITGSAWVYGVESVRLDEASDPFPNGFVLSDMWGFDANAI